MPGTFGTPLFWRGPYVMRVASSVAQTESDGTTTRNQWLYTLEPVDWGTDYFYVGSLDTDTIWTKCINIWEINNTSTVAMGLPVNANSVLEPAHTSCRLPRTPTASSRWSRSSGRTSGSARESAEVLLR